MVKSCQVSSAQKSVGSARAKLVKRLWLPEEDEVLARIVKAQGPGNWAYIAKHLPGRIGKQCRERWYNHLCPSIKKAEWSPEEKWVLFLGHTLHGSQWRKMTALLPGRTDNSIKNCWNSSLKKLLGAFEARLDATLAALERPGYRETLAPVERGLLEEIRAERARKAQRASAAQSRNLSFDVSRSAVIFNAGGRQPSSPVNGKQLGLGYAFNKENNACNGQSQGFRPCKGFSPASTDHSLLASNSKSRHCFLPVRSLPETFPAHPVTAFNPDQPIQPVTHKVICFDFYDLCPS